MTVLDLKAIAFSGGGLDLDFARLSMSVLDLKSIASSGSSNGSPLIIRNARLSVLDMKSIASSSPGNVTFVL